MSSLCNIHALSRANDVEAVEALLEKGSVSSNKNEGESMLIDERDDCGLTPLHICATFGCYDVAVLLLNRGAQIGLQDFESGWTPLHRSLYFHHLKISLLLIKCGAILGDAMSVGSDWKAEVSLKRETSRSIRTVSSWRSNIDNEGLSPLDLLSSILAKGLAASKREKLCTSVLSFGRADFQLGIPLPNNATDVIKARRIDALLDEGIVDLGASKYHSIALTRRGEVWSWGHGRAGRLGHGNEVTQPSPLRMTTLPLGVFICSVSCAENHTLALSSTGAVYSWGSDRFGQLGHGSSNGGNPCFVPKHIEALKKVFVQGIAAGEAHSVCFSDDGEIWAWGSNKSGQLGIKPSEVSQGMLAEPKRVTSLGYSASSRKVRAGVTRSKGKILQVAASHYSTLLLRTCSQEYMREGSTRAVNEVFQWGHGSYTPNKVNFLAAASAVSKSANFASSTVSSSSSSSSSIKRTASFSATSSSCSIPAASSSLSSSSSEKEIDFSTTRNNLVDIVQIGAGKHHNVALSRATHVYTWGLGSDQLGHGPQESSHLSNPQLVEALLPENGGGRAVFVCATSNRTCVLSESGELYTWGATSSNEQSTLGPGCGSYQPVARRVVGVKRAISIAAGEEHTLVLCSATVPTLPLTEILATADFGLPSRRRRGSSTMSARSENGSTARADSFSISSPEGKIGGNGQMQGIFGGGGGGGGGDGGGYGVDEPTDEEMGALDTSMATTEGDEEDEEEEEEEEQSNCSSASSRSYSLSLSSSATTAGDEEEFFTSVPTLKDVCQRKLAKAVNLRSAIYTLANAETLDAKALATFCAEFIEQNFDAILVQSRPADLELLTQDLDLTALRGPKGGGTSGGVGDYTAYASYSALEPSSASSTATSSSSSSSSTSARRASKDFTADYATSPQPSSSSSATSMSRDRSASWGKSSSPVDDSHVLMPRERSRSKDLETLSGVSKLIRAQKKKIANIEELENRLKEESAPSVTKEQLEKILRKSTLQSELKRLSFIFATLERQERTKANKVATGDKQSTSSFSPTVVATSSFPLRTPPVLQTPPRAPISSSSSMSASQDKSKVQQQQQPSLSVTVMEKIANGKVSGGGVAAAAPSQTAAPQTSSTTVVASPPPASIGKAKKGNKFIPIEEYQNKSGGVGSNSNNSSASKVTVAAPPSFADWEKLLSSGSGSALGVKKPVWSNVVPPTPPPPQSPSASAFPPTLSSSFGPTSRTVLSPLLASSTTSLSSATAVTAESSHQAPSSTFSLASFLPPTKQPHSPAVFGGGGAGGGGNQQATAGDARSKASSSVPAACPWSASSQKAASNAPSSLMVPVVSLSDIQKQEEEIRNKSSMKIFQGHTSPWFVERRSRGDSLDKVQALQEAEKELEKRKKEQEAKENAVVKMKRDNKKRSPKKQQQQGGGVVAGRGGDAKSSKDK